jgi:hypothetical protein
MGPCVKDRHRKTIDRLMWRVVLCVRGSRLAPRDRVGACKRAMCTARGAPCRKDEAIFCRSDAELDVRCIGRGKKIQPLRARRAFKKVIFLSIDYPHICSPRPPPLICDCRRSWSVFVGWVAVEQSTVRSQTMTRIGITSSIHAMMPRQETDIQGATQEQCNYESTALHCKFSQ